MLLQQLRTQGNPLKEVLTPGRNRYPVGAPFVSEALNMRDTGSTASQASLHVVEDAPCVRRSF